MSKQLTAGIQREGDGFVALCPKLDVASQGDTIEAARGISARHWNCSPSVPRHERLRIEWATKSS